VSKVRDSVEDLRTVVVEDSSGNVGIGTSTVLGTAAGRGALTLSGSTSSFLNFGTGSTRWGGVYSDATKTVFLSDNLATFEAGNVERMRLDSSGNLLVGTTDAAVGVGNTNTGHSIGAAGYVTHSRTSGVPMFVNRNTNDGNLITLSKDGVEFGNIGTKYGTVYMAGTAGGVLAGDAGLLPGTSSGTLTNGVYDLGGSPYKFKDLHLSGTANVGAGNIHDVGGDISINQGSNGLRINDAASAITATNGGSSNSDATTDLGISNIRFRDLYLSGTAYTGKLRPTTTGVAGAAALTVTTTNTASFIHSQENLSPNMTNGQTNLVVIGKADSAKNSGYVGYRFVSDGSDANSVTLGHWGSNHHLNVLGNGHVLTPNQPAFQFRATVGQTLATGWSKVLYTGNVSQRGGTNFDSTLSRFTAPVSGYYHFSATLSEAETTDIDGTFCFALNGDPGSHKGTVSMPKTGGSYMGRSLSSTTYLGVNDYIEVYRYSTVVTTARNSAWAGTFSGHLLG